MLNAAYYEKDLHFKNYSLDNIEGEIWKDCLCYDGIYSVSNFGRVKSEHRYLDDGRIIKARIMKQQIVKSNTKNQNKRFETLSLCVTLAVNTKRKTHKVAVLVGSAFIQELKKGECFSKKNKRWNDCRLSNLEILPISESIIIAYEKGNNLRKKNHLRENQKDEFIWIRINDGKEFLSSELENVYGGGCRQNIRKGIKLNGKRYGSLWARRKL